MSGQRWAPMTPINEIARDGLFTDGDWVESKDQDPSGQVRLTQLADVGVGRFRDRSDRWMREDQASRLRCTFLRPDDVLIARMPEPLGRACIVPLRIGRAVTAVDVAVLRIERHDVEPRFVMWALNGPVAQEAMVAVQSGTTRKRISRRRLGEIELPLPPIEEQRRIVDTLEDHLSRLDAAAANLRRVNARQRSLIASTLATLTHEVPAVPLNSLAMKASYGTSTKCIAGGPGAAVARIPNIIRGEIDMSDEKRVADPSVDVSGQMLEENDLLIVRTNGSRDLIGRSAVVGPGVTAAFASYLIRYKLNTDRVLPRWVNATLAAPQLRVLLERLAASSAGQYNLSLGKLGPLPIPVPSMSEQERGLRIIDQQTDAAKRLQTEVERARVRANTLHRALLQAAFSGRLIRHPSDIDRLAERIGV